MSRVTKKAYTINQVVYLTNQEDTISIVSKAIKKYKLTSNNKVYNDILNLNKMIKKTNGSLSLVDYLMKYLILIMKYLTKLILIILIIYFQLVKILILI